jgi:Spy/CpxP family protein refolding chaperone
MAEIQKIPLLPKSPKAWLTLLIGGILVFSGMVIGAGGTVLLVQNRMDQPGNAPEHFNRRLAERMTRDMGLTEAQESNIHEIFKSHRAELRDVKESVRERIDSSFSSMQTEVEGILTPEQAAVWNERIRYYNSRGERPPSPRRGEESGRDGRPPRRGGDSRNNDFQQPSLRHDGPSEGRMRDGRRSPPPRQDSREGGDRSPAEPRRQTDQPIDEHRSESDEDFHRPPPPPQ